MTQEDKELLLKDLCARLPYHVMVCVNNDKNALPLMGITFEKESKIFNCPSRYACEIGGGAFSHTDVRPYLRPISSMTEEEKLHVKLTYGFFYHDGVLDNVHIFEVGGTYDRDGNYEPPCEYRQEKHVNIEQVLDFIHWLNAHHFDYRGLIEKGLALEAPKGMY